MSSNPSQPPSYPPQPTKVMPPAGVGGGESQPSFPTYPSQPTGVTPTPPTGGEAISPPVRTINRFQFIKNYANMVARTWFDDSYRQLLMSDPVKTLADAGIPTVPGAQVIIVENKITGVGRVEDEVEAWIEGNQTGRYLLWLPLKPENVDLSGGGDAAGGDVNACCCCTPCCCCT